MSFYKLEAETPRANRWQYGLASQSCLAVPLVL